jgi:large subunit ribosomal protein L2
MAIKAYKPTTPARRGMTTQDFSSITTGNDGPKKLKTIKKSRAGRNNTGRITVRHRGGGVKKFYRNVNFALVPGTSAVIEAIEYDPNRSARIARIKDEKGHHHYVLASNGMTVGQTIVSGDDSAIEKGNRLTLAAIPVGSIVHNIELTPGKGGQMVRSAGAGAQLMAKEGKYAQIKMPSGEVRLVLQECQATLGIVGNEQHQNIKIGSAGRKRKMGWRPSVKGKVMNAVDHPHGGGDGGKHGVGRVPKTPWGQVALGRKTRRRKDTNKFVVRSRHAAKRS